MTQSGLIEFHVSPVGDDQAPGTFDHPLATLEAARDRIRSQRQGDRAAHAPATVWLHPGVHQRDRSFVLGEADSGQAEAPVTYRGMKAGEARVSGGRRLDPRSFTPVTDAALRDALDPSVREHVRQCDLGAAGVIDTGGVEPLGFGFGFAVSPADLDVYLNDVPLRWARWPRERYAPIGEVLYPGATHEDPHRGATFICDEQRVTQWSQPTNLRALGMWRQEWAPSSIPVKAIDPRTGAITLARPSTYSVQQGMHFCVFNAVEEIRQPGDWAVDHQRKLLLIYPPDGFARARLEVSTLIEPLIVLDGARHVVLRDLTFEAGRDEGVTIRGSDNLVAGCVLRNLGGRGVIIEGERNVVRSCHLHQLGQGGITLNGGDRRTLTPSRNMADNNEIHDVNRVAITYNPGVHVNGCGAVIRHNLFYDGPHNAILLGGNDHLIEYNEFHHVAMDTDDAAAIYYGRNPSEQGNVVRFNYFHHVGSPSWWGTSAIYPDDGASGMHVHGNVFYQCGHAGQVAMGAIFVNAGKDHVFENNVFVDCRIAIGLILQTDAQWRQFIRGEHPNMSYVRQWLYEDVDITSELYLTRYPTLRDLAANPTSNIVRRNLTVRCGKLVTPQERQTVSDNWSTSDDPGFVDAARLNFALTPDSEAFQRIPGFVPPPFERMGLRQDEYRPELPARTLVDCRVEVNRQPVVSGAGERATGEVTLHLANLSARPCVARIEMWTTHPETVTFGASTTLEISLAANETRRAPIAFEAVASPDVSPAVGARLAESRFSLTEPVRPRYRWMLPSLKARPDLSDVARSLATIPPQRFFRDGDPVGELRLAAIDGVLVGHAMLDDPRFHAGAWPFPRQDNLWGGPLLGLLAARSDASDAADVAQVIFFPHGPEGPDGVGDVWCYHGIEQRQPPATLRWTAAPRGDQGWELAALIPFAALGLPDDAPSLRLEAMANLSSHPDQPLRLATLYGSKTARLELATLAEVTLDQA